jgi:hypothetical protein
MKDFKKMPKMACGGGVKGYDMGGNVSTGRAENALPSIQAQSREMQAKGIPANLTPEQMRAARMTRIAEAFGAKPAPKRTGGSVKRKK